MFVCGVSPRAGAYAYFEADDLEPGDEAVMVSATIPEQMNNRCLSFFFHAGGPNDNRGHFEILDENSNVLWRMLDAHSYRTDRLFMFQLNINLHT